MTDDIDQIMSEIEELQNEMNGVAKPAPVEPQEVRDAARKVLEGDLSPEPAKAPAKKPRAKAAARPKLKMVETPPEESAPEAVSEPVVAQTEGDHLEEFRAGGHGESEAGLDHAMDDLAGESQGGGAMSLLDEAIETPSAEQASEPLGEETREIQEIHEAEVQASQTQEHEEEVPMHDESHDGSPSEGCLTMQLTGQMTLKLKYDYEGQEVTVGFSDGALMVTLADGTEFKVPVAKKKPALRRVA